MLEDGVAERIKTLLRSDMPPVQFKLLGTLRMLVDGQGDINMAGNIYVPYTLYNTVKYIRDSLFPVYA